MESLRTMTLIVIGLIMLATLLTIIGILRINVNTTATINNIFFPVFLHALLLAL